MKTLHLQSVGPPGRWGLGTGFPKSSRPQSFPGAASLRLRRREQAGERWRASVCQTMRRSDSVAGSFLVLPVLLAGLLLACSTQAQTPPVLMQQVISREYSIHVGGVQTPEYKELVSREVAVFVGDEPTPPFKQVVSREFSIVVTTPAVPAKVSPFVVTPTPTGESVTLSWSGYNEWAQADIVRYDIYMSTRGFTNVSQMTRYAPVPGETFSLTLTNLPAWGDQFFAVVAVDALGGLDPVVNYAAAYVIAREVASREFSLFVGDEPTPPFKQVVSREVSIVVTTPVWPALVTNLTATPTPTGVSVTLSWSGYNEWAQSDIVRYDIYLSTHGFTNVSQMIRYTNVPGETFTLTLTNLPAWEDHSFAVVPVDALGGFSPTVQYAAAYVVAREVASREYSVFIGAEPAPPYQQVVSREVSIVVSTPDVPAPVTCLDCGLTARDSVNSFQAIDLDWSPYNELAQKDVVRYRVYLGPTFFDDVSAMSPYMTNVPAETKRCTVPGLNPYGIYYVAVVAEDVLGQINPVVRSQSAQASVDRVREVRNLAAACGTNSLTFTWQPPEGADPYVNTNNLLALYRLYLAGAATPVVLDRFAVSFTATNLLPGHSYPVLITTVDISNRVSEGASLLAATLVPNPAKTSAHPLNGFTRVAWEELLPDEAIDRFLVYLATTNFTSVVGMTPASTTRGHRVDFPNLVSGKTYYFAVITRNIAGCDSVDLPLRVVSATPGETAPTVLQAGTYADGVFNIVLNGPLGADYVLLSSTDLIHWVPERTNTPAVLPFGLTVTNQPGLNRFYRVIVE